jgi:hypothetical protein
MKSDSKRIFNLLLILLLIPFGCSWLNDDTIVDEGENIQFVFDEGLNDDPRFRLTKDDNGYYFMNLEKEGQNIQRITVKLLDGDQVVYNKNSGRRQSINWENNLYWWVLEGDTVANITKTYFNPFTGEIQYVNLPPLINWKEELVPTINASSITDETTGRASTVIGPIGKMKGDTMKVYVRYNHQITKYKENSMFFTPVGEKIIMDSVKIILR